MFAVRYTYGDVVTLDAIQSATSTEHIHALPSGSAAVNSFKNYVGLSRARETSWLVVSDGAERAAVMSRRALGNVEPVTEAEIWSNVARNLARQPAKELATDLVRGANRLHVGSLRSMAEAFQPAAERATDGKPETVMRRHFEERRASGAVAGALPAVAEHVDRAAEVRKRLTGPKEHDEQRQAQLAKRAMRAPAARSKRERPRVTAREAEAEFREALHRAGLRPKGPLHMDGQRHYTEVEGSKSKRGFYVAHLDGAVPAGTIINHRTGVRIDWRASSAVPSMTPGERRAEAERIAAAQAAREASRRHLEASAAQLAKERWEKARPIEAHAYLASKGVRSHGMRQDRRGNLLIPMQDADGRVWGLQTIRPDGRKLYQKDARRKGTHALLGKLENGAPLVIAEGFATAATLRETTGLAVAVAFDAGGLMEVARAYRKREPMRPIIIAADNDHHLPRREVPLPNVGSEKAQAAAEAVGGVVLLPAFNASDKGTDWNDYAAQHGKAAVRAVAEAELRAHGVELPGVKSAVITQADRDASRARASAMDVSEAAEAARRAQAMRPRGPTL